MIELNKLEKIKSFGELFPIYRIGSDLNPRAHRFFDTSPISPSGKYIALIEFNVGADLKNVAAGDSAKVVVYELSTGDLIYSNKTYAWDSQLGSHIQWGADDKSLFYNQMNTENWVPFALKVNIFTNEEICYQKTVYMVNPDGTHFLSPCLKRIKYGMLGYGVVVPQEHNPVPPKHDNNEGAWITDTQTQESRLLISLSDIYNEFKHYFERLNNGYMVAFHLKWNRDGKHIMFVIRWIYTDRPGSESCLITMDSKGKNLKMAVDFEEWEGGHHPNWSTSDDTIVMNLKNKKQTIGKYDVYIEKILRKLKVFNKLGIKYIGTNNRLYFKTFDKNGENKKCFSKKHLGSGHPILTHNNKYLIADAYLTDYVSSSITHSPLRLINIENDSSTLLANIHTKPIFNGMRNCWRIDPHPVMSRCSKYLIFNGSYKSSRQVFIMDLSKL